MRGYTRRFRQALHFYNTHNDDAVPAPLKGHPRYLPRTTMGSFAFSLTN